MQKQNLKISNQSIADTFALFALLLELHNENEFKIRSYNAAIFKIEKIQDAISELSQEQIRKIAGVGKSIAEKIIEIIEKNTFEELEDLLAQTPEGVLKMLKIKGLGAKRVRILWKEAHITSLEMLSQACERNQIAQIKGFGEKMQESIKNALLFVKLNSDKLLYADALPFAQMIQDYLSRNTDSQDIVIVGDFRRATEVIANLELLVRTENKNLLISCLDEASFLEKDKKNSGVFVWRGCFKENKLPLDIHFAEKEDFYQKEFLLSSSAKHLAYQINGKTLLELASRRGFHSETEIYEQAGLPYLQPELREGFFEFNYTDTPSLIENADLKGTLHTHSTYSDGKDSLAAMAEAAKAFGFSYMGITDHSKSAYYANGLDEKRVAEQQKEIDELNAKNPTFRIFKGIEADILSNGDLDYDKEILKTFDFVVASIHSNLQMSESKATQRLIKAIENPFTTIIGHPTGRLLLRREGYPLHLPSIIDACAANRVALEINAHPLRLDLDWRWVWRALEKGVKIVINADAHDKEGYAYHQFGVLVARKAGLSKENCLNTLHTEELERYFRQRK